MKSRLLLAATLTLTLALAAPPNTHADDFPATGQTTSYHPSDDGAVRAGAPLSFEDNEDGTVTDDNTGLTWEKLSMDGSIHDVRNIYTWGQAFGVHVATLNSTHFAGHHDWRVPNVKELESIVNFGAVDPAVSAAFNTGCVAGCKVRNCSCTADSSTELAVGVQSLYWSSTTDASAPAEEAFPGNAWGVLFRDGFVGANVKENDYFVRAVRGFGDGELPATGQTTSFHAGDDGAIQAGAPLQFEDKGDGTITDENTGLMWEKKSADGSIHNQDNAYNWFQAFDVHVATLNSTHFAGHHDWRLPNVKELESIVNYGKFDPAVSPAFNTKCTPGCTVLTCSCTAEGGPDPERGFLYWSSTTEGDPFSAWGVNFQLGFVRPEAKDLPNNQFVRAVRGGSDDDAQR